MRPRCCPGSLAWKLPGSPRQVSQQLRRAEQPSRPCGVHQLTHVSLRRWLARKGRQAKRPVSRAQLQLQQPLQKGWRAQLPQQLHVVRPSQSLQPHL